MKKYVLGLVLIILCSLISCNKEILSDSLKTSQRSAGDGDLDLLGYGYDAVDGNYGDEMSSRGKVIDVKKIQNADSNRIEKGVVSSQNMVINSAENSRSYIKNIMTNINVDTKLLLFSSTLRTKFNNYDSVDTKYSYASIDKLVFRKHLKVIMSPTDIREDYLSSNFREDCKNMTIQQILEYYGSYVLTDIKLGAKLNVTYRSEINNTNKKDKVEIGVKFGAFKVFGLGMSVSGGANINESELIDNKSQSLNYTAIGGDPSINIAGTTNLSAGNTPTIDLTAWQNSVTLANSHLIEIGKNGLLPIYEIMPGYRGVEMKEYFMKNHYKLELGMDYFDLGNIVFYDNWWDSKHFLFLNFPDGFNIVGVREIAASTIEINKSYFNKVELYGNNNIKHHIYDPMVGLVPYTRPVVTDANKAGENFNNILKGNGTYSKMDLWKFNIYPQKDWSLDLVQLASANKYYVRWREYIKSNANDYQNFSEKLYPIAEHDITRYGFSKQYLKQITTLGTAVIGKSF
ncbi:MAC/perforin domain-containing protein [Sphingobacterium faecium]|uniref:MAC/perforin domain-containing protein n=1 Tax=Sphingobacterium faecium TaxID=34087 RepID=UPI003208D7E1